MSDSVVTVVGEYQVTEGQCETGPCWHVRGPAIHSVCETLNEARWGAGVAHSANVAGYKQGKNESAAEITRLRSENAAMREALEKIRSGNDTSGAWSRWIAAKALPPKPPAAEEKKE